ncbi:MAG TPA: CpsB/CapC family capsule biosynthesis tyrosine phosphatase [Gaiellaceae bacterium]
MIDTHCHLLPSLDDGPSSDEQAVELAGELVRAGVTAILCTPHFNRRYPTSHEAAREQLDSLQRILPEHEIHVRLELGAEIGPAKALDARDDELVIRAIAQRWLLVELEPDTPVGALSLLCDRVDAVGLLPVFAHPERCRAIQRDPAALVEARERGALAQVVASSLGGSWGRTISSTAWGLLASGRADLVGSDSHRPGSKRPLASVLLELEQRLGAHEARRLLVDTPGTIVNG